MNRRARGMFRITRFLGALILAPFLAACDGGKPPEPAAPAPVPRPAAIAPPPAVTPAPAAAPAQPGAKQAADAALVRRIKAALDAEPQIHGFNIDVTADNGKVALFGTVQTKVRRDKAEQIAKGVSGVKSVDNNLAIVAGS